MMNKIDKFWDRCDFYLRVAEENIHFKGWEAALMTEFSLHRAAMTQDGAHEFVGAGGKFLIAPAIIHAFIDLECEKGLLEYHYEVRKTGQRMRVYKSALQPDQFEYQIIVKNPNPVEEPLIEKEET